MIDINLIPLERRKKGFPLYKIYSFGIYFVLAVTLLLWLYSLFVFKYNEAKLKTAHESIVNLHVWQERYELNQVQNAALTKRSNIIANLSKSRMLWSDYLAELGNVTPYGCWLTSVTQDKNKTNIITVEGNALKMEQLLTFINNLQKDPHVTAVSLVRTQTTKANTNNKVDVIHFILNVSRNGGKQSAK